MKPRSPSIFVCYAHDDGEVFVRGRDEDFLLASHAGDEPVTAKGNGFIPDLLTYLKRAIDPHSSAFIDNQIPGGMEWSKLIEEEANRCNVCFILITPGLAGSVHVALHELPLLRQLHRENRMVVIPIYLQAIDWNRASHLNWLLNLQVLPDSNYPLNTHSADPRMESVHNGISRCLRQLSPSFTQRLSGWFRKPWIRPAALSIAIFIAGVLAGRFLPNAAGSHLAPVTGPPTQSKAQTTRPQIELVSLPPFSATGGETTWGGIAGKVTGVDPASCSIVIYAMTNKWWVQPVEGSTIPINPDGSWISRIHLGTHYAVLLVNAGYEPRSTLDVLPSVDGQVLAIQVN